MEREDCNYHPLEETHILLLRSFKAVIEPIDTLLMQGLKVLRVRGGGAASQVRSSLTRQWGLEVSRKPEREPCELYGFTCEQNSYQGKSGRVQTPRGRHCGGEGQLERP